ncbi:hypothetical protein Tco_0022229, partial [Tanacetum coccineum]
NSIRRIHFHRIRRIQLSVQYSVFIQLINTAYSHPLNMAYRSPDSCTTRSSNSELFTPYKEPEREFRSSRRHLKILSLDELRSLDFNLFSDLEYSEEEEEVEEPMAETMKQYMSKTRADYGSSNTFNGLDHEDANAHIEKVLEIVDLFNIPNITIDQVMLRAFHMPLTRAAKPDENLYQAWERFKELLMKCPQEYLMEMQEVVLFYNGLDVPTRQILDSRGAIPSKTVVDAKVAI